MARVLSAPDITHRAVTCDGRLVGSIAAFVIEGETEVTYWIIDRAAWGRGIASHALELLLEQEREHRGNHPAEGLNVTRGGCRRVRSSAAR